MAATATDIVNLAMARVGHKAITSINDPDAVSVMAKLIYEAKRDSLLRQHPWLFARYMDILVPVYKTISGATQASPVVITSTAHGFENGQWVKITDVVGMTELNGHTFKATNVAANTFELETEDGDVDGTAYTAYVSGGYARMRPPFKFEYEYALPTGCLNVLDSYGSLNEWPYEIKRNHLLCNADEVYLEYTAQVTDTTKFGAMFTLALYLEIAVEYAEKLADRPKLAQAIREEARSAIAKALRSEAWEGVPADNEALTSWQSAGR